MSSISTIKYNAVVKKNGVLLPVTNIATRQGDNMFQAIKPYAKHDGLIRNLWSIYGTDPPVDDPSRIYGVRWDKTASPNLERVYDSVGMVAEAGVGAQIVQNDFDNTWFNFEKVQDDYGNHFVRIPKFYIRKSDEDSYFEWAVSQVKHDDSYYLPWCFWDFDNDEELPYVDIGAYEASSSDNKLASIPEATILRNTTIVDFRTLARNNNTGSIKGYQQYDIHVHDIIQTLMFIEFATLNMQSIMRGRVQSAFEPVTTTGFSSSIAASSGSLINNTGGTNPCVWRGIENPYGNLYKFVDGVNISYRQAWVCKNAELYSSDVFAHPYEQLGYVNAYSDDYVTRLGFDENLPFAQFPVEVGGSESTYFCDYYRQNSGQRVAQVGGHYDSGLHAGPSYWYLNTLSSYTSAGFSARLVKKAINEPKGD